MKNIALGIAALFMILLFDHTTGHAVPAPHDFQCLQCHVSHNSLGSQSNDLICFSCHNPSGGAKAQGLPFSPADAADPFGTQAGLQTSHNWSGSDTNLKAGAQPPVSPALAISSHNGKMLCSKCHNLHGPKESASNSGPFLRMLNDNDQMCLDCHRARNTQDHATGSHPVLVSYTGAVKRNATGFYATPRSANPANPTASMKIKNGKVVCSTCHGVHYTDSNSATYDNRTSALLGLLTPSAGYILRTDMRGAAADAVNICTNCHQNKTAHNAGGQNIQCTDCHGAHVAETDGSTPNVWLIRRFMSFSTATGKVDNRAANLPTNFTSTTTKNYRDGNGTGVCQSCHQLPNTVSEHSQPNIDCNMCHYHSNASGSFTPAGGSCTTCHGQPPTQNVAGGPDGYASGYTGVDESASAHNSHVKVLNFICSDCHKGNTHRNGNYQQVFLSMANTLASKFGATPSYNTTTRTCSTTYCHSNGAPANSATKYATVGFANGKGAIMGKASECVSCHGGVINGYNNMSTNAHYRHVSTAGDGKGFGCATCHGATVSNNGAISDRTKHVNGNKDLSFTGNAAGVTFTNGSCSTSYCHSNGKGVYATVSWTNRSTGSCGNCHAALSTTANGAIASNAHTAHLTAAYGPKFDAASATNSCAVCHSYTGEISAGHVNGTVDLNAGFSKLGTCVSCHQQTTNWTPSGRLSCESCHTGTLSVINGKTAPAKPLAATSGHGRSDINQPCVNCHDNSSAHIGVAGGTKRLQANLSGALNTECKYCHDNGTKVRAGFANMSTHFLVKGGSQAMACAACHDAHGTSNLSMIRTSINGQTINFTDATFGFVDTNTNQGLCQTCHTQTAHYKAGVAETNHPVSGCLSCHSHRATGGAFKPKGACDSCHGYPPAPKQTLSAVTFGRQGQWSSARFEDYSGGGGAHLVAAHVNPNAKPSEGWANCAICHNSGITGSTPYHQMALPLKSHISNVTVAVDPRYRFDNSFNIYTGAKLVNPPAVNATGSCFNMSCHMSPSPRWSVER